MSASRKLRWFADILLLATAAVWGATFFMVKEATHEFPVLAFLLIRFSIAVLALLPFTLIPMIQRRRWPKRRDWLWGIAGGLLFWGGYLFQTFALRLSDSGRVGFITGLYVILVPLLALPRILVGSALALIGMVLLGYAPGSNLLGDVLAMLCAVSYAGQILVVEKMPGESDWRFMALVQAGVVAVASGLVLPMLASTRGCDTVICTALANFAEPLPTAIPSLVWAVAAYTGLLATAAGLVVQTWAQRIVPPSDAALIFAMESPFSVVFGVIFLSEIVTPVALLGCAFIFAGMLTTTLRSKGECQKPVPAEAKPAEASAD
jgi:drug/metabolite transporter (DMT)-like permease